MAGTEDSSTSTKAQPPSFFRNTVAPLFLMLSVPCTLMCTVSFVITCKSSPSLAFKSGFGQFVYKACTCHGFGTCSMAKRTEAHPRHRDTDPSTETQGFTYYVLSMLLAGYFLIEKDLPGYPIYRGIPSLVVVLVIVGFVVSALLYVKGLTSPSPGEHGSSGSVVFDFFWGLELYPRIGKRFDVKLWTNSRFGMMLWQILVLICWKAQTAHAAKFFWREERYVQFADVVVDRSGCYLSLGYIAFMGPMYAIPNFYMVEHNQGMSLTQAIFLTTLGLSLSLLHYWCDYQKQLVRNTQGNCSIGRSPVKVIRASYQDNVGNEKTELLPLCGFWSICRRPDYVLEILIHLCWALPAGGQSVVPYMSTVLHVCVLMYEAYRFEDLCAKRYGQQWKQYCSIVKYRMIPYVY
ncbi:hypothetical protein HPB50_022485 [Hyalomma asiaticum]|uniref:Uncharacterized protein n=1 Tax=Hyalomma asiaticum TaxID=266040 RepID=A0ACB7S255_HYAAI|nr:hypothetical protein HPB50_022485 [Hyalomma asiaticum]